MACDEIFLTQTLMTPGSYLALCLIMLGYLRQVSYLFDYITKQKARRDPPLDALQII
jgi:hypothetical protein